MPNTCYIDGAMFKHEQDTLFGDNWTAIGLGKDISEPGMVNPLTFLSILIVMVRKLDGTINVFQNV